MRPVVLKGEQISLSVVLESDAEKLFQESNDLEMNHYFRRLGRPYSQEEALQQIRNIFSNSDSERIFAIVKNEDTESGIGHVGLHEIDWKSRHAHVSYALSREYWGNGYMTEAVKLLIKYAFEIINLRKLHTYVMEPNAASRKILEKSGFTESGRLRKHTYVYDHGYSDEILYELFRSND